MLPNTHASLYTRVPVHMQTDIVHTQYTHTSKQQNSMHKYVNKQVTKQLLVALRTVSVAGPAHVTCSCWPFPHSPISTISASMLPLCFNRNPRAFALTALHTSAPYSWLLVGGSLVNSVKSTSSTYSLANPLESVPVSKMISCTPSYGILPAAPYRALHSSLLLLLVTPIPSSLLYSV